MTASASSPASGRLREIGIWRRFLNRPEFGSIIGAIVVWTFFAIIAGGKGFTSPKGIAGTLEISHAMSSLVPPSAACVSSRRRTACVRSGITSGYFGRSLNGTGLPDAAPRHVMTTTGMPVSRRVLASRPPVAS